MNKKAFESVIGCTSEKCTGCGACKTSCPSNAISMQIAEDGYWYPMVNMELCVQCGTCSKICESRIHSERRQYGKEAFCGWSCEDEVRYVSTSGGAFSEISKIILDQGGYVAGAVYKGTNVCHSVVSDYRSFDGLRQSKYVQSDIGDSYQIVRELLNSGTRVLFSGTPCQIAGLYSFLGADDDNLFTISFICRGVCSPVAYKKWIEEFEQTRGSRVAKVWFKYKRNGWKESPRTILFEYEDGTKDIIYGNNNYYMSAYLDSNLIIRPSCGNCDFKGGARLEDITLGDYWGAPLSIDDDRGLSVIISNTEKGSNLINELRMRNSMFLCSTDYDSIEKGNPMISCSVERSSDSDFFISMLQTKTFSDSYRLVTS